MAEQKKRRIVVGEVVSDRMDKTIRVVVIAKKRHPVYRKYVPTRTFYKAHDEENQAHLGDVVQISFTRPISKTKCWKLDKIVTVVD